MTNIEFTPGMMVLLCQLRKKNIEENPQAFVDEFKARMDSMTVQDSAGFIDVEVTLENNRVVEMMEYRTTIGTYVRLTRKGEVHMMAEPLKY